MGFSLHTFARNGKTFARTIAECSNWLALAAAKIGLTEGPLVINFRDGFANGFFLC